MYIDYKSRVKRVSSSAIKIIQKEGWKKIYFAINLNSPLDKRDDAGQETN